MILEKDKTKSASNLRYPGKLLVGENVLLGSSRGNYLFISDSSNHRVIITMMDGKYIESIGSGMGLHDGSFEEAQFHYPQGLALNPSKDKLYMYENSIL